MGEICGTPKTITIVTTKITDQHNKYNDDEKVWNIAQIAKSDKETRSQQMLLERWYC